MKILSIKDEAFKKYGKIIEGLDLTELAEIMKQTEIPEGVVYEPSIEALESTRAAKDIAYSVYGGMPIQIGYCNGHNLKLNAFEYHRDSEVNIAAGDMVLILGCEQDITDEFTYDTAKAEAFLVPDGTAVELYATTLHYAPCHVVEEGFRGVVVLPKGTNTDIEKEITGCREDRLLFARNKWLIAHKEAASELAAGAFEGLVGENVGI